MEDRHRFLVNRLEREVRLWRALLLGVFGLIMFVSAGKDDQGSGTEWVAPKQTSAPRRDKTSPLEIQDPQIRDCVAAGKGSPGIICLRSDDGKKAAVLTPSELGFYVDEEVRILLSSSPAASGLLVGTSNGFAVVRQDGIYINDRASKRSAGFDVKGGLLMQAPQGFSALAIDSLSIGEGGAGSHAHTLLQGEKGNPRLTFFSKDGKHYRSFSLNLGLSPLLVIK